MSDLALSYAREQGSRFVEELKELLGARCGADGQQQGRKQTWRYNEQASRTAQNRQHQSWLHASWQFALQLSSRRIGAWLRFKLNVRPKGEIWGRTRAIQGYLRSAKR